MLFLYCPVNRLRNCLSIGKEKRIERHIKSIAYSLDGINLQLTATIFRGLDGRNGYTAHLCEAVNGNIPLGRQFIYSFYSFQEAPLPVPTLSNLLSNKSPSVQNLANNLEICVRHNLFRCILAVERTKDGLHMDIASTVCKDFL